MEVFSKLGVDGKLLIAQILNFLVFLGILYWFLYRRVIAMLEKREHMVAQSVRKAGEIDTQLTQTTAQQQEILNQARIQAQELVTQARTIAQAQTEKAVEQTKQEVAQVVTQAKVQIEAEKKKMLAEASDLLADIVVQATKTIVSDVSTQAVDRALVQKAIDRLKATKV